MLGGYRENRPEQGSAKLSVRGLTFSYPQGGRVFADVDFRLPRGCVCTILGRNGIGKTTLLNCIGGYLAPEGGSVLVDGKNVADMPASQRAQQIGFVAQMQSSSVDMRVLDYLVLGDIARMGLFAMPHEREYRKAEEVMREFRIEALAEKPLSILSGGERQQVEIARVIVQNADLILMDEPTNHLDYGNQMKVLQEIRRLAQERGKTIVLTTHMPDHALYLDGYSAVIEEGGKCSFGRASDLVTQDRLRRIYGVDVLLIYVQELGRWACLSGGASVRDGPAANRVTSESVL